MPPKLSTLSLVLSYWVRTLPLNCPKELMSLILSFLKPAIVLDLKHKNEGKLQFDSIKGVSTIHRMPAYNPNDYISFSSTIGYNSGIVEWFLEVINIGLYISVGICSTLNKEKILTYKEQLYFTDDSYFYFNGGIYEAGIMKTNGKDKIDCNKFTTGDIIKIVMDFEDYKVEFFKNENSMGRLDIVKNVMYYPVVQLWGKDCQCLVY